MNQLAADTGGHAFYNTNDLATAANRAISEGSHYYTLVLHLPGNKKMDGKFRQIAVKLAGGHYQLSYRRGYNADDPATLASAGSTSFLSLGSTGEKPAAPAISDDPLRPLLMRGLPSASQLLYAVRVVPANPQPRARRQDRGQELPPSPAQLPAFTAASTSTSSAGPMSSSPPGDRTEAAAKMNTHLCKDSARPYGV